VPNRQSKRGRNVKKHFARFGTGLVAAVVLGLVFWGLMRVPLKIGLGFVAAIGIAVIGILIYKIGDFIGYVFFDGKF
jgi:hypothetical protein